MNFELLTDIGGTVSAIILIGNGLVRLIPGTKDNVVWSKVRSFLRFFTASDGK